VAGAEMENAAAAIGQSLLPAVVAISGAMSAFSKFAVENKGVVLALGVAIGVVAAAVLAINVAFKLYRTAVMAAQAAQWLLNAAQSANPLGIILIAVLALVAGIVLLWHNSETFRTVVTTVFNAVLAVIKTVVAWITTAFNTLAGILSKPFNAWLSVVKSVIGTIQGLFNGLMGVINHLLGIIGDLGKKVSSVLSNIPKLPFSLAAPPPAAAAVAAPTVRGLAPLSAVPTGGGRGQTNVTMVLDREVFGRVMIDSLRRYDRRNGAPQVLPRWS
jgi:phage-related protein